MSKSKKLIVHMIGNAHLDPAWLWAWTAGLDEALNTCRTACDLLDRYPEFHVTRGEAWVYDRVATIDPALFRRIAAYVKRGRWHPVNGWWIQPDCNLPGPVSFQKQAEIGGRFFRERLGVKVRVGYNVDSFGHCEMMPSFLRAAGMESYVFMRPSNKEHPLSTDLFRWRSPDGAEVPAFRIARGYASHHLPELELNINASIEAASRTVGHTMCFYGVGDHGGGPTREQIEWIRDHSRFSPDIELRFSHPQAFFDAIKSKIRLLPVVAKELQHHAVGCYAAVRDIKREIRRAEELLTQAESLAGDAGLLADREIAGRLTAAWKRVLFNEFHDVMAGTCIEPACVMALDELGHAKSEARELISEMTRRTIIKLPPSPRQRLVIFNPSPRTWRGLAEFEPWMRPQGLSNPYVLRKSGGRAVPHQLLQTESPASTIKSRIVFPVNVAAGSHAVVELKRTEKVSESKPTVEVAGRGIGTAGLRVTGGRHGVDTIAVDDANWLGRGGIRVGIFEDPTDTWSHGVNSFSAKPEAYFRSNQSWAVDERGPLRASLVNRFEAKDATLLWQVVVEGEERSVRMKLRLHWSGIRRIVKLIIPPAFKVIRRRDGVPGAIRDRELDGKEWPVRDVVAVEGRGCCLAAISADIYGVDVQPDGAIRMTLVRSPAYAHHDPFELPPSHAFPITDQGEHEFEVVLMALPRFAASTILDEANRLNNPLWIAETTRGMPSGLNR